MSILNYFVKKLSQNQLVNVHFFIKSLIFFVYRKKKSFAKNELIHLRSFLKIILFF